MNRYNSLLPWLNYSVQFSVRGEGIVEPDYMTQHSIKKL